MNRREFIGTLVAAGATLAAVPSVVLAEGGSGASSSPKPGSKHVAGVIPVTALNHVALEVPDPARSVAWYQRLFGLPIVARHKNGTVVLRVGDGPQSLMISGGGDGRPRIKHLCLGVDQFDPDRAVKILKRNGFAEAVTPGIMKFTRRDRDGTTELFFGDSQGLVMQLQDNSYCGGSGPLGNQCGDILKPAPHKGLLKITDLNHVTCFVTDMGSDVHAYQALFGFQIDTFQGPTPILRVGSGNQQLILVGGFNWPGGNQIDHVCFDVEDFDVKRISKVLNGYGVKFRGQTMRAKGPMVSYWTRRLPDRGGDPNGTAEFYFSDPDGIYLQLQDARYCGGSGYLGDKCGTPEHPTGRGQHHGH